MIPPNIPECLIRHAVVVAIVLGVVGMSGCTAQSGTSSPAATTGAFSTPRSPTAGSGHHPWWGPVGEAAVLASGLDAPWSVVPLAAGGALISQRDDGRVRELTAAGVLREVGTVSGVVPGGEAGLNGLALWTDPDDARTWLYAYHAASDGNRVVRMPLLGDPGAYALGASEVIFSGIAKARNHDGGRLAFGPDGMLYVTTGDASNREASQNPDSLGGKILRLTPDGDPAPGNPFDSAVWSLGHRNVQGIAWTTDGTMWASEFGQNTWDELNVIVAGANYGWPVVEGKAADTRFTDPVAVWSTSDASPSGIAAVGDTVFLAALRGERLWSVDTDGSSVRGDAREVLAGQGRLRDAVAAPDGSLWVLTNNTDGRGDDRAGGDLLLRLALDSPS